MYDIKWIRKHPDAFDRGLKRRGLAPLSGTLLKLDETRRALITKLEQAQARRNAASKEIGQAKAKKDETTAQKWVLILLIFHTLYSYYRWDSNPPNLTTSRFLS